MEHILLYMCIYLLSSMCQHNLVSQIDPANKMSFGHYNLQSKDNGLPPAELALAV